MSILCRLGLHRWRALYRRPFDPAVINGRQVTVKRCTRCEIRRGFTS